MLVVTGSIGFDYILNFPGEFSDRIMPEKIHQISLSFLVDRLDKQWGGTAGNISYTLGLFGNNPILFATAGNDFAPYKKYLAKNGVDVSRVKEYNDISTGSYFVITDQKDNQIGAFYTGAMQHAKHLSLTTIGKKDSLSLVVIAPNDPDAMRQYVRECQKLHIPYMYDPAFQIGNFSKKDLTTAVTKAEILIGNDYEIELICKKMGVTNKQLVSLVPIVITTLGDKGARIELRIENRELRIGNAKSLRHFERMKRSLHPTFGETQDDVILIKPARAKNTSDPTGAGDCFRAGFLAGYVRGLPLQTCGQMGATAAVYTVEKYGTTTHTFSLSDFAKRYKKNYGKNLKLNL